MAYLGCEGVNIHFQDDGAGPAILLSHGFGASVSMWDGQVDAFKDRYRLVRWDMRGHGESDCPEDQALYTQDRTIEDMRELLDALAIETAVIAGHSLGGYLSLAFHARYPERVRGLILQGCGPGFRNPEARAKWNERAEDRARTLEEGGLSALGGGSEVKASVQGSALGLARAARGILSQRDSTVIDSLPHIAVPTLVILGDGDTPFLDGSAYMARRIPDARHVVVENAGHGVNVDQPEATNRAFEAFLADVG